MTTTDADKIPFPAASIIRRLLAIFYDIFLLTAILFLAAALFNAIANSGEAVDYENPYTLLMSFYLAGIIFLYFSWFWTHGGQTLGMKTWKVMLVSNDSQKVNWEQALTREAVAIFSWVFIGLGFFWSIFDKEKRTWHDISSNTRLIDLR